MKKRTKSSKQWLKRHFKDPYVKQAQNEGYRSRAAYKLLAIQEKDKLLHPGMTVVDLGAAPGGWSQVVSERVKPHGLVIAVDCLMMPPIEGVEFIQGDFTEDQTLAAVLAAVGDRLVDCVLSDMAPNLSGAKVIDQPRIMHLVELALEFAMQVLKPQGHFLVKIFQGEGFAEYYKNLRLLFNKVETRKPPASRSKSQELYLLAKEFKGIRTII